MTDVPNTIGDRIRELRHSADKSQAWLAHKLRCRVQRISEYENGRTLPRRDRLNRILQILEAANARD